MQLRGQRQTLLLKRGVLPDHRAFRRSERKRGQTAPRELGLESPIGRDGLVVAPEGCISTQVGPGQLRKESDIVGPPMSAEGSQDDLGGFSRKDDGTGSDVVHACVPIPLNKDSIHIRSWRYCSHFESIL